MRDSGAGEPEARTGGPTPEEVGAGGRERAGAAVRVRPEQLLHDWAAVRERALAYLAALHVPGPERDPLVWQAVRRALAGDRAPRDGDALRATLRALRDTLGERDPTSLAVRSSLDSPPDFTAWRLERWQSLGGGPEPARGIPVPPGADPESGRTPDAAAPQGELPATPPIERASMGPAHVERRLSRWMARRLHSPLGPGRRSRPGAGGAGAGRPAWSRAALARRLLLLLLVAIPSAVASAFMLSFLPFGGRTALEAAVVLVFGALFGWISIGFWTALLGFGVLLWGDRFAVTRTSGERGGAPIPPQARTAVLMPVCEEPVDRVFAGLRAVHDSLARDGALSRFDFFVLSDSRDPSIWAAEQEAWAEECRASGGFGRVFYRRRRLRQKRKSGNVADFCRRFGQRYRYMVLLDADSVMSGQTLVRLVQLMERSPRAGLIQTLPRSVGRGSAFARVQQFANRVYAPLFAAGLHYWQLGDGPYWGHNAIVRVDPFMRHCGLPRLPGRPPLGGEILSHDFVEAALLRRAGFELWLAYDLPGSYEEPPSTLLHEMKRDRRWCQGNLQHLRLLFTEGLYPAHRALFLNGVLSYVSALLWFAFLSLSTAKAVADAVREPDYFPAGPSLFPEWPVWQLDWAYALGGLTLAVLFLPKVLGVLYVWLRERDAARYGGAARLWASALLELALSALLAPIRMLFHSRFVLQNLVGRTVSWGGQSRGDEGTSWGEALRHHGADSVLGTAWGLGVFLLNPAYFWWITPIVGALFLSIPLSVLTSRARVGERARRAGLFLIPEEAQPPRELQDVDRALEAMRRRGAARPGPAGLARAVADPFASAVHAALGRRRRKLRAEDRALVGRALAAGPGGLDFGEARRLLEHPVRIEALHSAVWALREPDRAAAWLGEAGGLSRAPGARAP